MLTVAEIAERLATTRQTINRHVRSGRLKAHRFGRMHLVDEADYAEWVRQWRRQRHRVVQSTEEVKQ